MGSRAMVSLASLSATAALSFTQSSISLLRRHALSSSEPSPLSFTTPSYPLSSIYLPKRILDFRAPAFSGAGQLLHDAGAAAVVMGGAYALVSTFDNLTQRNLIQQFEQKTGPYIVWVAFHGFLANFQISVSTEARYFACLVPLVNCFRLVINGLSLSTDEGLTKSVTRGGNPEELLKGPLYYVVILILCALVFWRESPVGVVSLAMMCGGDGVADIMGRRFGYLKIPYNQQKSWAGTISMFVVGFLTSIGMLYYFSVLGYFQLDWVLTIERVALISLVATAVESLPTTGFVDDNISVPLVSMAVAFMCFGY
ncbi:hypothetical protein LguiB_035733 [Lonicera macranthoides]